MFYGIVILVSFYIFIFGSILALISYYYTHNKIFQQGFNTFLQGIDDFLKGLNTALGLGNTVSGDVEKVPPAILSGLYTILAPVIHFLSALGSDAEHLFDNAESGVKDAYNAIKNFF